MQPMIEPVAARRRRSVIGALMATLPLFLLAGLLVAPGLASAGIIFGPDLVVTLSDSPDPVEAGGTVTFTVLVANVGNDDSNSTTVNFNTGADDIVSAESSQGSGCTWEGTSVSCDLGYLPGSNVSGSGEAPAPALAFYEAEVVVEAVAPSGGQFDSTATADSFNGEQSDINPGDNEDSETTDVEGEGGEGGSDSGVVEPGGSLSTVTGTNAQPVTTQDPFAIELTNVSDMTFDGFIEEEPCDGSQAGALCSVPRVGGVAGNFVFDTPPASRINPLTGVQTVVIAKLFYDKTIVQGVTGFKIFYQKNPSSEVIRLPRCRDVLTSECFVTKKRASGDQIVRVKLGSDPRITRG